MMEVRLHPAPQWRDVVREQIQVVGLSLRREALVIAAFLGAATVLIVGEIVMGEPGFDSDEIFPMPLLAFFYPFAVWRSDKRFAPAFLWTLPVERRQLALAKVFAGGVWMGAALAAFATWLVALAFIDGVPPGSLLARVPFTASIVAYLFGSALVLGFRHPWRWLIGIGGVLVLIGVLQDAIHLAEPTVLSSTLDSAEITWRMHPLLTWTIAAFLSLGAGLAALLAATSRHRETR